MRSSTTRNRLESNLARLLWAILLLSACADSVAPSSGNDRPPRLEGVDEGKFDDAGPQSEARAQWVRDQIIAWNIELAAADRDLKYEKMAESVYVFFRGTNHLFWADLAQDPRLSAFGDPQTRTFVQGDLHALNFGSFHNDDGLVVYDLNDFDEAFIADYQLDVWRMAVSIVLVGRQNGLSESDIEGAVDTFSEAYLDALADYDGNSSERGRSFTAETTWGRLDNFLEDVAQDESRQEMLDKWTVEIDGWRLFDTDLEKLEYLDDATWYAVAEAITSEYATTLSGGLDWDVEYFAVKDVARRLQAGTGSLGTPRFYVLIEGPTDSADDDIILDIKRQGRPTGYWFTDAATQARYDALFQNHARRAVEAQRAMLAGADDHLGWLTLADGTYSVRERSPYKDEFPIDELTSDERLSKLAEQWGIILATDHARADRDFDSDYVANSFEDAVDDLTDGHHDEFRALTREVAREYADQVAADYQTFLSDVAGR